jgi:AcrR family transcriptional regulator
MSKKREQRNASIERLLASALRLFVSHGYGPTNLEQIAGASRMSKGVVYFYFGSKEAVLLELLKRVQSIVVDEALQAAERAGSSAADRLVAFLHHQAKLGVTHRDEVLLLILMSLEFGGHKGAVSRFIGRIYRRLYAFVEQLVREGQSAGEVRQDLQARELAAIVMANHDGTFLEWHRRSSALAGPALVRALREVMLSGVTKQRRRRKT